MSVVEAQPPAPGAAEGTSRVASVTSDLLGLPVGIAMFVAVGAASDRSRWAGAGWGLLAITIAAVLPFAATYRMRRDRPTTGPAARSARVRYLAVAVTSAAVGIAVLAVAGAPHRVLAVTVTFMAGAFVAAAVNTRYRMSNHTTAVSGAVAMLTVLYGPLLLLLYALVAALAWSRLRLRKHTLDEVAAGIVVGGAVSAGLLALLT